MMISDWISIVALGVSSGALALNIRGWLASGPHLHLSVIADAVEFPRGDGKPKLALFVTNRGDEPTTLTHMVAFIYRSRWAKARRRKAFAAIVNSPTIPAEVGINKTWSGLMLYGDKVTEARTKGQLYVGVFASHTNREFVVRVPPPTEQDIPKEQIPSA
jgi:hypothetical protein